MGSNAIINSSCNLRSRDIDRNHDWINNVKKQYSDADLIEADKFVNKVSTSDTGQENADNETLCIDY